MEDKTKEKLSAINSEYFLKEIDYEYNENYQGKILDLEQYYISDEIWASYYLPDFLSQNDQTKIEQIFKDSPDNMWESLKHAKRRVQKLGGDVTDQGLDNVSEIPKFLNSICHFLKSSSICPMLPNHILLNDYPEGIGIMPHTDGPLYYPYVNNISLSSDCLLKFFQNYEKYLKKQPAMEILLEQGALVIFTDDLYAQYLHCIDNASEQYVYLDLEIEPETDIVLSIKQSSISNFKLTSIPKQIIGKTLKELFSTDTLDQVDQSLNQQYLYCYIVHRFERFSITIRHVPLQS